MRIPPLKKEVPGAVAAASGTGTQVNRVEPYCPTLFTKLATIAALFVVQLAGGCALVGFWIWRAANV